MTRRFSQFFIQKFNSDRLKKSKNKITITLDEARRNNEIVSVGDNQVLRTLRRLQGRYFSQTEVDFLFSEKKKVKRKPNTAENRAYLLDIEKRIDEILFVPEIISILIVDNRHYAPIIKDGIYVNGIRFNRLLCGSGNARRSTAIFVDERYEHDLKRILNNERDLNFKINPSKFNAYFGLYNSATLTVSTPKFCVIPDCKVTRPTKVDFMVDSPDGVDDQVEERIINQEFSLFDGQGLISPKQSKIWAEELGLNWMPASYIFRGPFLKGMLATFDFHDFANKRKTFKVTDVWGNEQDIRNFDVIISESQLKLWKAYKSVDDYVNACNHNELYWGISRYTPKHDKTHSYSTYQFLQTLNIISQNQIEHLCDDTVDWFAKICGDDRIYAVLYLMGDTAKYDFEDGWFDAINDPILKLLLLEPELIKEPYIRQHIVHSINKKIKESYMGVLILNNANYQMMIADPYAQAEHALGLSVGGLLKEFEHYSQYWNKRKTNKVAALRAPQTWKSETVILDLQNEYDLNYWYRHLYTGIVFNVFGVDAMRLGGADNDGDLVQTVDQKEFVECACGGNPVTYDRKSAGSQLVDDSALWENDLLSFHGRIGFITNVGSSYYAALSNYSVGSPEYNAILNRLKLCCCWQSMEIDKTKGIQTKPFPDYWTKWIKIKPEMSEEEIERANFYNSIICDKRPYFFRWLYQDYNYRYLKHRETYENYAAIKYDLSLDKFLEKENKDEFEEATMKDYFRFNPLLDSDCIMNKIAHHMEKSVKEIKLNNKKNRFDYSCWFSKNNLNYDEMKKYEKFYQKFKEIDKSKNSSEKEHKLLELKKEIFATNNNIYDVITYAIFINTRFAYMLFANELVDILREIKNGIVSVPIENEQGSISYLGKNYMYIQVDTE